MMRHVCPMRRVEPVRRLRLLGFVWMAWWLAGCAHHLRVYDHGPVERLNQRPSLLAEVHLPPGEKGNLSGFQRHDGQMVVVARTTAKTPGFQLLRGGWWGGYVDRTRVWWGREGQRPVLQTWVREYDDTFGDPTPIPGGFLLRDGDRVVRLVDGQAHEMLWSGTQSIWPGAGDVVAVPGMHFSDPPRDGLICTADGRHLVEGVGSSRGLQPAMHPGLQTAMHPIPGGWVLTGQVGGFGFLEVLDPQGRSLRYRELLADEPRVVVDPDRNRIYAMTVGKLQEKKAYYLESFDLEGQPVADVVRMRTRESHRTPARSDTESTQLIGLMGIDAGLLQLFRHWQQDRCSLVSVVIDPRTGVETQLGRSPLPSCDVWLEDGRILGVERD